MILRQLLVLLFVATLAVNGVVAYADAVPVDPDALVGKWYAAEVHPDHGNIETRFVINADHTFSGSMTINNIPSWQYSGTWSLKGDQVTWVYVDSNIVLLNEDLEDIDVILSLTDESLTYRSLRRGKESTLQRMK